MTTWGGDSWDWVGHPLVREHDSTPQSGVEALRLSKRSLSKRRRRRRRRRRRTATHTRDAKSQGKTERQLVHSQFGLRQVWFLSTVSSRGTSTSTRRYEVSGFDPGTPANLDVRFTDDPSLSCCLPNMPRQLSESGGSFSASEPVVFSESYDVNGMRSQVAQSSVAVQF